MLNNRIYSTARNYRQVKNVFSCQRQSSERLAIAITCIHLGLTLMSSDTVASIAKVKHKAMFKKSIVSSIHTAETVREPTGLFPSVSGFQIF